jgi:hypothetical protein
MVHTFTSGDRKREADYARRRRWSEEEMEARVHASAECGAWQAAVLDGAGVGEEESVDCFFILDIYVFFN